jgi:hypothetical protein
MSWEIWNLDHLRNGNPVSTKNQTRRYFLRFPTHPYTTYSGKQNQGYSGPKVGSKRRIQQKPGNWLGCGARVRFCSRTELKKQLGQKWSIAHDLFRLGWISKRQLSQFSFTLLDRICPEWAVITKLAADLKRYRFQRNMLHKSCT